MNKDSKPLAALYGYRSSSESVTFLGREDEISVELPGHISTLERILKNCSGRKTWEEILEAEKIDPIIFEQLADFLMENGIVVEGSNLYEVFHEDSSNPLRFANSLKLGEIHGLVENRSKPEFSGASLELTSGKSTVKDLCAQRSSHRAFTREAFPLETLSTFLSTLYGVGGDRRTPSAGQLYPLEIYVIVKIQSHDIDKGVYWFDSINQKLVRKDHDLTGDEISFAMNTNLADAAPYIICIAADLKRVTEKYSNRGYRFAFIEAGHVCQNAYLVATELNLGIVSYGGFLDEPLKNLISDGLTDLTPLLTMILGYKDDPVNQSVDYSTLSMKLVEELVGNNKPIDWYSCRPISKNQFSIPKFCTNAKYRSFDQNMSSHQSEKDMFGIGVASSDAEATVKAIAEAYERYCCSVMRTHLKSKASDLGEAWLNPNEITPMSKEAKTAYGLNDFSVEMDMGWVKGYRFLSGESVLAPVDHVYYPIGQSSVGRKLIYSSSSSGVAAHTDIDIATSKAMFELVERDAIAVMWYTKKPGKTIPRDFISPEILNRVRYWENLGWTVKFLNITLDSSPVVMAVIAAENLYPCFSAGASSSDNYSEAIKKAWDEAETLMWGWRNRRLRKKRIPETVSSPLDHGRLYFLPDYYSRVKWLLDFEEQYPDTNLVANPLEKFDPVVFDVSLPQYTSIKVVRVISEQLMPINFGYMSEHSSHRRVSDLGFDWKESIPAFPHFLA